MMEIDEASLASLLLLQPPPLGLQGKSDDEGAARFVVGLKLPKDDSTGLVKFDDVINALVRVSFEGLPDGFVLTEEMSGRASPESPIKAGGKIPHPPLPPLPPPPPPPPPPACPAPVAVPTPPVAAALAAPPLRPPPPGRLAESPVTRPAQVPPLEVEIPNVPSPSAAARELAAQRMLTVMPSANGSSSAASRMSLCKGARHELWR